MAERSRAELVVYAAIAVGLLLLGVRALRAAASEDEGGPAPVGTSTIAEATVERGGRELVVHVAGAVADPGVYSLPAGSRVSDAVEEAGGPGRRAAIDGVNLAAPLVDGQQVVVPERAPSGGGGGGGVAASGGGDGPISLGQAGAEDLERIDGIGPKTAEKILAFRTEKGGVSSIDDLAQVDGIGPKTLEKLRSALQP